MPVGKKTYRSGDSDNRVRIPLRKRRVAAAATVRNQERKSVVALYPVEPTTIDKAEIGRIVARVIGKRQDY